MIIELLVNLITTIIKLLAAPFAILPDTPQALINSMDYLFNLIFSNLHFINFFVNIETFKSIAVIAIVIWTLDKTYGFLMWIIRKLPFSIN